jgi:uncharacterized protein (TIGR04255 family)
MSESFIFDYERPPIVEVVAAVTFDRLPENALVHFGLFWESKLAEAFPRVEERAPYVPPVERFGTETLAPQVTFFSEGEFPSPRLWFLNEAGDELLQLQRNWFACNWRKVEAGSSYSHWPTRRKSFKVWFGALSDYVDEAGLGTISPTQCEVTYINHILAGETWKTHGEVAKIFRSVGESQLPDVLERESTRFNLDFLILGRDGEPGGGASFGRV